MTDKTEIAWPDAMWPGPVYGWSRCWSLEPLLDHPKYIREDIHDALIASQAAEIAALREREIMRLAGISTAAQGYFKDGESIHPDYDTVALRDVTALYRKYESQARSLEQLAVLRGRDESLVNQ